MHLTLRLTAARSPVVSPSAALSLSDWLRRERASTTLKIQAAQIPGAGAIATARGLASIWSSTVVETVSTLPLDPSVISDMTVVQSSGASYFEPDRQDTPHWATGFMVDAPARPFLSSASFGHDGAGGQLAFADSDAKVGFGFVTNDMQDPIDGRANGILEALRNITSQ